MTSIIARVPYPAPHAVKPGWHDGAVRTVVLSDLHLGAGGDGDLLRRPSFLSVLTEFAAGADRIVLLGDVLELRDRPLARVVEMAEPVFEALGALAGESGEIVVVAGNHDHHLAEAWLERRALTASEPLGLEHFTDPEGALAALAERARPARVRLAYPGL
jgi:predicted phosphodiesterase